MNYQFDDVRDRFCPKNQRNTIITTCEPRVTRRVNQGIPICGPGFSSPNQPDRERTTAYRDSSGPDSRSDAHCATIVGDWEEPSGESRLNLDIPTSLVFSLDSARAESAVNAAK